RLTPYQSWRLQSVSAKRSGSEAGRIGEAVDIEIALLRRKRKPVWSDIDVRQLHLIIGFELYGPVRARQIDVGRAREAHRKWWSCLEGLAVNRLPAAECRVPPASAIHIAAALSHWKLIRHCRNPAMADIKAGAAFFQSAVIE